MFCPICRLEYREGFKTCSDCDVTLVDHIPVQEAEAEFLDPVVLMETSEPETIALAESLLQGARIPYLVEQNDLQDLFGAGRIGGANQLVGGARVVVPRADEATASALLQDLTASERSNLEEALNTGDAAAPEEPRNFVPEEGSASIDSEPPGGASETPDQMQPSPRIRPSWFEVAAVSAPLVWSIISGWLADRAWSADESEVLAPAAVELYTLLGQLPAIILISWIAFGLYRSPVRFGLGAPRLWDVGTGIMLTTAWLMIDRVVRLVLPREPGSPGTEPLSATGGVFALALVVTAVLAVSEELYYRSYLIPQLSTLLSSRVLAVAFSALLFGLGHSYQGAPGVVSATIFGVFFGVSFLFLKSLWPVALAHTLANTL